MNVRPDVGWILIAPGEDRNGKRIPGEYYICWPEIFTRKKSALKFAAGSKWMSGYKAVRATLSATAAGRRALPGRDRK